MKKVGLFTFHRARNIGTSLQAYALQKYLETCGEMVEIVDYRPWYIEESFGIFIKSLYKKSRNSIKGIIIFWIKTILRMPFAARREYNFKTFWKENFRISEKSYGTYEELQNTELDYTHCVYGSDQIWNPDLTEGIDNVYFGMFNSGIIHFSYAASIGKDKLKDGEVEKIIDGINNLSFVGVREKSAKAALKRKYNGDIQINIDPTLLLEKKEWMKFIKENPIKSEYVFVYVLEKNQELIEVAKTIAEQENLKIVFLDLKNYFGKRGISKYTAGPSEFLNYIYHAKYVITNSFHGTVFSIIFHKQFFSIPFQERGTRVVDLLEMLGISERIIYKKDDMYDIKQHIDYENVEKRIEDNRECSRKYIINALGMERA